VLGLLPHQRPELLARQVAISLENARLFTARQEENSARKRTEAALRELLHGR
jgi:GAF domain-containing protein